MAESLDNYFGDPSKLLLLYDDVTAKIGDVKSTFANISGCFIQLERALLDWPLAPGPLLISMDEVHRLWVRGRFGYGRRQSLSA